MDDKKQEHGNRNPGQEQHKPGQPSGQTEEERRRQEQQRRQNPDMGRTDPNERKDREEKIA